MKKTALASLLFPLLAISCLAAAAEDQTIVKVIASRANVRLEPDVQSPIIAQVTSGTLLESEGQAGDWYLVSLPPDTQGNAVSGYINRSMVEVILTKEQTQTPAVKEPAEPPAAVQPPPQTREPAVYPPPQQPWSAPPERLFYGTFLKFGWMRFPDAGGFGNAWLASVGFDLSLGRNLGVGLEIQPATRNYPDIDLSIIPVMAFGNIKAGLNLGQVLPFLKFLNIYGGGGAGVEVSYTRVSFDGEMFSELKSLFAYHLLFGTEIDLGSFRLIADYQLTKVSDPSVDPDSWCHYLLFGIRF